MSVIIVSQQNMIAHLERNMRIMGERLRMHDVKFQCLEVVEPTVIGFDT
jgi:hypothetical protein